MMRETNCGEKRIRDLFIDKEVLENSFEAVAGCEQETGKAVSYTHLTLPTNSLV